MKIILKLIFFVEKRLIKFSDFLRRVYIFIPSKTRIVKFEDIKVKLDNSVPDGFTNQIIYPTSVLDKTELNLWSRFSQKSEVIFDIGSNIGFYAILSSLKNKNCEIHTFEPNPINNMKIRSNVTLNRCKNVIINQLAIGDKEATLEFFVPIDDKPTAVSSTNKDFIKYWHKDFKSIHTKQVTIDSYVQRNNLTALDLIKLDVETYELNALKGGLNALRNFKPNVFIELHLKDVLNYRLLKRGTSIEKDDAFEIHKLMINQGYHLYVFGEHGLIRVDSVVNNDKDLNYLYSVYFSQSYYTPYNSVEIENYCK